MFQQLILNDRDHLLFVGGGGGGDPNFHGKLIRLGMVSLTLHTRQATTLRSAAISLAVYDTILENDPAPLRCHEIPSVTCMCVCVVCVCMKEREREETAEEESALLCSYHTLRIEDCYLEISIC